MRILRGRIETFPFLGLRSVCTQTDISTFSQVLTHDAVQPLVARAFVENPDHSHLFEASPLSAIMSASS
jgi:hypothetical protein